MDTESTKVALAVLQSDVEFVVMQNIAKEQSRFSFFQVSTFDRGRKRVCIWRKQLPLFR